MIRVYDGNTIDFTKNGNAILMPTECKVVEEAGGSYELTLTHPIDNRGIWQYLKAGWIIKAPVTAGTTESIVSGDSIDVYKAIKDVEVRSKPIAPTRITYKTWIPSSDPDYGDIYDIGEKVTDPYDGNNYQCKLIPLGSDGDEPPSAMPSYWTPISNYAGGASILLKISTNSEVYKIDIDGKWIHLVTMNGIEGYSNLSDFQYEKTISVKPIEPHKVTEQLFRIYHVSVNTKTHLVTINARHVSYDAKGILIGECVLLKQPPSTALAIIKERMLQESFGNMVTNLTEDVDGSFDGTYTYTNAVNALLDPDIGFVNYYKARLFRDNWDFYIYRNSVIDRGVKLKYGVNLKGVTWINDSAKLVNRIIPTAKNADGSELLLEDVFVDSPTLESYPVINMERLNVDGRVGDDDGQGNVWTVESLREYMANEAQKRFDVDNADKISVEISVDFQLLGDTVEYKQYHDLQKLYLYDTVEVSDPNINLNEHLQVTKITWDAIRERYISLTLGNVFEVAQRAIAGYQIANGAIQFNKLSVDAINKLRG